MRPHGPGGPDPDARHLLSAREGSVFANGIELWYDDTGDPGVAPVLLIHTMGLQSRAWGPEVTGPLHDAGLRVIRVDNRDNGRSEWIDYARHPYDIRDMAVDMVCLLDALDVPAANLVGFAMGSMVAQQVTVDHPERVLSLTSIAAMTEVDLGRMEPHGLDVFGTTLNTPPPGRRDALDWGLRALRTMAGRSIAFDEDWWRDILTRTNDRYNVGHAHAVAMTRTPSQFEAMCRSRVPTLFVHSDDDPLYPLARVSEMCEQMASARLHTLDGAGRDLNPAILAEVMPHVLAHITEAAAPGASVA